MKKLFYVGLIVLAIFEFVKVYWIMPLSGSQKMDPLGRSTLLSHQRDPSFAQSHSQATTLDDGCRGGWVPALQ